MVEAYRIEELEDRGRALWNIGVRHRIDARYLHDKSQASYAQQREFNIITMNSFESQEREDSI